MSRARDAVVASIRAHEARDRQLALADEYIAAIKAHGKVIRRRLPIPNRLAILRQLG